MISHRYRAIFIHIPKCAGTSVEDVLWPKPRREEDLWMGFVDRYGNKYQTGGLQHLMLHHIVAECGADVVARYFTFAIVRNPFDRLVSQYKFTMARRQDLRDYIGIDDRADFATYLAAIARRVHVQWLPQHQFVEDQSGAIGVDRIVRFEAIDSDLPPILEALTGTAHPLPHANANVDRRPYRSFYGPSERAMAEQLYADDLVRFGYEF